MEQDETLHCFFLVHGRGAIQPAPCVPVEHLGCCRVFFNPWNAIVAVRTGSTSLTVPSANLNPPQESGPSVPLEHLERGSGTGQKSDAFRSNSLLFRQKKALLPRWYCYTES